MRLSIPRGPRLSLEKSFLLILLITIGFSGTATAIFVVFHLLEKSHAKSKHYTLNAALQTHAEGEILPTLFFAERLGLSVDHPINIYDFDIEEGVQRLEETHLFQKVKLQKRKPSTLLIDYHLRQIIAYVGGVSNMAFDEEGMLLPRSPFYRPKNLPEVYFNQREMMKWGERIEAGKLEVVLELLSLFKPEEVESIDLSWIEAPTIGKREVVLHLREGSYLRLTPKNYVKEIKQYRILKSQCKEAHIVDLRIPQMAFIRRA